MKQNSNERAVWLKSNEVNFLKQYKDLGFENESAMVCFAIKFLQREINNRPRKKLIGSCTDLFAEMYSCQ